MSVVVVGLDHRSAPLEMLEKVAVTDHDLDKVIADLRGYANIGEVVVVSTCLRTEVYAVVERFHDAVAEITEVLAQRAGLAPSAFGSSLTIAHDYDVASHLFSVAAGLESSVPGESEVLGQVRRAHERAMEDHVAGPVLNELFRAAIHAGKRVRTETPIARGATSFASAAVSMAASELGGSFTGRSILLVGAGDLGAGIVEAIVSFDEEHPPTSVAVANRTLGRAEEVLAQMATSTIATRALGLDDAAALAAAVHDADVVVCAIDAEHFVIDAAHLEHRTRPVLVVDLGVPRNVDPEARELPHVTIVDVADLGRVVKKTLDSRRAELDAGARIVVDEVLRYQQTARARSAAPVVAALRQRVEDIRRNELDRRRGDFDDLDEATWEKVEALTRSITAKVLHDPTTLVKDAAGTPRGERIVEVVRALFAL